MEKQILVYLDEGVGPHSFRQILKGVRAHPDISLPIKPVNAGAFLTQEWEKTTRLLIFPGGRDVPYHDRLKGEACKRIRQFIEKGGKYLGICAGAYFASSAIEFEKGGPLEVHAKRELKLFPGKAIGPAYGSSKFSYESEKGAEAALIDWGDEELLSVYYNGGCYFEAPLEHSKVTVLARYAGLEGRPAAIIHRKVGKGQALLSGVHPEYHPDSLDLTDPFLESIIPNLKKSDTLRQDLFNHLFNLLLM